MRAAAQAGGRTYRDTCSGLDRHAFFDWTGTIHLPFQRAVVSCLNMLIIYLKIKIPL